jgi:dUTP pyrophosphatase
MATRLVWDRHPDFPDARAPERAHPTDAGFDVFSAEDVSIPPGEVVRARTGICVYPEPVPAEGDLVHPLVEGYNQPGGWTYACLVWDKSGLGSKGLKVMGGVIDDPYTGELLVVLANVKTAGWFDLVRHFIDYVTRYGPDFLRHAKPAVFPGGVEIKAGQKVANLLVQRVELPEPVGPQPLARTGRGSDGFGSTGQ